MGSHPTKLTLRLDRELIKQAKRYAQERGTSISRIVADYFKALSASEEPTEEVGDGWKSQLPPITKRFVSRRPPNNISEADYYRHLEEKYR
jgi:hypothetical protein